MSRAEKIGLGVGAAGFVALFLYSMQMASKGVVNITNLSNTSDALNTPPKTPARTVRGNNPGNIRFIDPARAWRGQIGNNAGIGVYDTIQNGTRALWKQLEAYKLKSVRAIITKWAPAVENPTESYVGFVAGRLGVGDMQTIELTAYRLPIVKAIARFEQGFELPYTNEEISQWTLS